MYDISYNRPSISPRAGPKNRESSVVHTVLSTSLDNELSNSRIDGSTELVAFITSSFNDSSKGMDCSYSKFGRQTSFATTNFSSYPSSYFTWCSFFSTLTDLTVPVFTSDRLANILWLCRQLTEVHVRTSHVYDWKWFDEFTHITKSCFPPIVALQNERASPDFPPLPVNEFFWSRKCFSSRLGFYFQTVPCDNSIHFFRSRFYCLKFFLRIRTQMRNVSLWYFSNRSKNKEGGY